MGRLLFVLVLLFAASCTGTEISGVLAEPNAETLDASIAAPDAAPDASVSHADAAQTFADASADAGIAEPEPQPDAGAMMPRDSWPPDWSTREDEMLVLVNQQRAQGARCGARSFGATTPLTMNRELREAARLHSKDMADQNYFDHNSLDGRDPWDRMRDAGYRGSGVGENIAAGNSTAQDTFEQWLTSPGHCSNMMSSGATEIGVGYAQNPRSSFEHYWTQTFGQ